MRIPLAVDIESRNGLVTKDAIIVNGFCESDEAESNVFKRPGNADLGLIRAGTAQLLVYWNGLKSIIGDYFNVGYATAYTNNTTWNPSDKSANVTLSGGSLTEAGNGGGIGSVRSTAAMTATLCYWENTVNSLVANNIDLGMANLTFTTSTSMIFSSNCFSYIAGGQVYKNNAVIATYASYVASDVISFLYNSVTPSIAIYKNGVLQGTLTGANVPTGTLYACNGGRSTSGWSATTNFGATAFLYSPEIISTNLSPTTAGLQFSAQDNGSNAGTQYLMLKNAVQAWTLTNTSGAVPVQITDVDYPGTYTVTLTSLTRTGTVATATTATDTNFQVGSSVTIAGATPSAYNGAQVITGITASSVTTIAPVAVTITRSGTTATAVSVDPHGFTNGQSITIAGATQSEFNGTFTITWISATSFSFTVSVIANAFSPATGSIVLTPEVIVASMHNTSGSPTVFTGQQIASSPPVADTLLNGATITVNSTGNVAGIPWGTYVITVLGANSFSFVSAGATYLPYGTNIIFSIAAPVVSSITSIGAVATVTTTAAHNFLTGKYVKVSGANQYQYNVGNTQITVTGATTFTYPIPADSSVNPVTGLVTATGTITATYSATIGASFTFTIAGSPATPATGTITASGGRNTVPGIGYINGYFVVMDIYGVIYNSAPDDPTAWNALEFTAADSESGAGVALAQLQSYIFAFKEWSTEPFYDRQDTQPGSPLSKVSTAFTQIGCASGLSLAQLDGALVWMAQTRQNGRSIYVMQGIQQTKISTASIDRILNLDDLSGVRAWGMKISGHGFYVLSLVESNLTLIYDQASGKWGKWTTLTIDASKSVTSITLSGTTATVTTGTAHALSDGDPVTISGATPSGYNGIWQITYVSTTVFTIQVAAGLTTPATGTILAYSYTESYYKFTHFANALGRYMTLHTSNGKLYEIDAALYRDAGIPIPTFFRSIRLDGGSINNKDMSSATLIADAVSDTMMIRWSDDDCATFSAYRPMDMSAQRPQVRRSKGFRRRTIEMKHIGNNPIQCTALELEVK